MNNRSRKIVTAVILLLIFMAAASPLILAVTLGSEDCSRTIRAWQMHARYAGTEGVVLQDHDNTCGPAALAMILARYGIPTSAGALENEMIPTPMGVTMDQIRRSAERRGLRVTAWRLSTGEIPGVRLPAMLFLRMGHFLVLDSVGTSGQLTMRDPAIGRLMMKLDVLPDLWAGETLLFENH